VKETVVLLAIAWMIPFLVHVLPWSGEIPLGAHLLPMFLAAFASVYLFGLRIGLLVGLFAPALNLLITGFPVSRWQFVLGFELIVFAVAAWWMVRRTPRLWVLAPMSYLAAKAASTLVQMTVAPFGDIGSPSAFWIESLRNSLPGMAVLLAINLALLKVYPKQVAELSDDTTEV
jgi:hypothetical protein